MGLGTIRPSDPGNPYHLFQRGGAFGEQNRADTQVCPYGCGAIGAAFIDAQFRATRLRLVGTEALVGRGSAAVDPPFTNSIRAGVQARVQARKARKVRASSIRSEREQESVGNRDRRVRRDGCHGRAERSVGRRKHAHYRLLRVQRTRTRGQDQERRKAKKRCLHDETSRSHFASGFSARALLFLALRLSCVNRNTRRGSTKALFAIGGSSCPGSIPVAARRTAALATIASTISAIRSRYCSPAKYRQPGKGERFTTSGSANCRALATRRGWHPSHLAPIPAGPARGVAPVEKSVDLNP